jgi:hypothetical protein
MCGQRDVAPSLLRGHRFPPHPAPPHARFRQDEPMSLPRLGIATALLTVFATGAALAQNAPESKPAAPPAPSSMKGTWVGFALFNGDQRPVKFTFDSTDAGWVGATLVPEAGADSIYLDGITVKKDSVNFEIPFGNQAIGVRGSLAGNIYNGEFIVQGEAMGTLRMARAGSAEAANLLTPPQ